MSLAPARHLTSEGGEFWDIFEAAGDGLIVYDPESDTVVEANPAACAMHGYTRQEFIGLNPAAFIDSQNLALFVKHAREAKQGSVLETTVIHLRKDGSQFYAEAHRSAIQYRGHTCMLIVLRDISQRIQADKILDNRLEKRSREQSALLAISHTLASTLEFQPGLILDQLRAIIEYTHGGLFVLEDSRLVTLAVRGTLQLEQSPPLSIHLQSEETVTTLFNKHRPNRIGDVRSDSAQAQFLRSLLEDGAAVLLEGMRSWMWVPLAVKGRTLGGMGVAHEKQNYFTSHHADLALSVANQAAITLINAELYENAQTLAVLEERQRLAHNLHDAVNQSLFSAGLIAEVLPRLWERDQAEARRSLEDLRRLMRGALAEMRALLAELRPATLTDSELGELIILLGKALSGRSNLPVSIKVAEKIFLPPKVQVAFYRVCQEALYNIAKHAKASQVEIHLDQTDETVLLRIHDNGQGFNPEQKISGHYGLSMMRERAEAAGALFAVASRPGRGTELTIRWTRPSA